MLGPSRISRIGCGHPLFRPIPGGSTAARSSCHETARALAYRFVHTADLHLDSPLRSLAMRDAALAGRVAVAAREAFERIVSHCLEERVDALMIAGDLYDGRQTSVKTGLFLAAQLARLHEAGIATFVVRGNHDAQSKLTRGLDLPPSVHVFDGRGGAGAIAREASDGAREVRVHGVSFGKPHAPDSLLPSYAAPTEDAIEIGLMHTSLGGDAAHDAYAPCALADLVGHGFAYWGLGHVHARAVHHEAGDGAVVMAGMPQGRDVGEAGEKSATLVAIAEDGTVTLDELPSSVATFARERVTLPPEAGWDDALAAAEDALIAASSRTSAPHLVARLEIAGASRDAWRLVRDKDALRDELAERLDAGTGVHLEKVEVAVEAPESKAVRPDLGAAPLQELRGLMREVANTPAFRAHGHELAGRLASALKSRHLRDLVLGTDEDAREQLLDEAVERGLREIGARLEVEARVAADGTA